MANSTIPNPDSLSSATYARAYSDFSSEIDLVSDGRGPAKRIRLTTDGVVAVKLVGDPDAWVLITYKDAQTDEIKAIKIGATGDGTTGVTKIVVYW